jgi:threonyl-tRNA synthetase
MRQVVGEAEKTEGTVNVRTRSNQVLGMHKLTEVLDVLKEERGSRSLVSLFSAADGAAEGAAADGS